MNEAQYTAVNKVETCESEVRTLSRKLIEAEARLKRAKANLRTKIRQDPESWGKLTPLPGGR